LKRNGNGPPRNIDEKPGLIVIGDIRPRAEPLSEDELRQIQQQSWGQAMGVIAGGFLSGHFFKACWSCGGD